VSRPAHRGARAAHQAEALNHISPHFADVVWRGLSTEHVRGLDATSRTDLLHAVGADQPARLPERLRDRQTLLVYAHTT
jgi:hypothetical protein